CKSALLYRRTLFIPTATTLPDVSKIAAPNGPPVPRSTLTRETSIASRIRSSSLLYVRLQSTTESTQSGYSTFTTGRFAAVVIAGNIDNGYGAGSLYLRRDEGRRGAGAAGDYRRASAAPHR